MRIFLLVFSVFLLAGCRQSSKIPADFDYGKIENGVFKNDFFGMEIPLPASWAIQTKDQIDHIMNRGREIIGKKNKELASKMKTNMVSTATLLMMFKHKPDSVSNEFNPSVLVIAENISNAFSVRTGTDYLDQLRKTLQQSGMGYRVENGYSVRTIGGKEFDVLRMLRTRGEAGDIQTVQHVLIDKRFALVITLTFETDEQEQELVNIIKQTRFR